MNSREEKMREVQEEIENEELHEKRKKRTIFFFRIVFLVIFGVTSFYLYTKYISTNGLVVKEKRIVSDKIPDSFHGVKIIQFSDLFYGSTVSLEEVKNLVKKVNMRTPDFIFFTGGLIQDDYSMSVKESEALIKELGHMDANIGKYAILNDTDDDNTTTILRQCGFVLLDNSSELLYNNDTSPILLSGLNDSSPDSVNKTFEILRNQSTIYSILLLRNPDDINNVASSYNVNLALSGRSLNGQICLYQDLCFKTFPGAEKYYKEYYKVNNTELFISSGIGTYGDSFRFMARPSINFFRLAKQ